MAGTIHYFNCDFDLSLRARPPTRRRPALDNTVSALTAQGLLAAGPGDAVLSRVGVPGAFVEYLDRRGIEAPRRLLHPRIDRHMNFSPFGWNAEAISINARQETPSAHPDLEVVRLVNSRAFSAALERDVLGENDAGRVFTSLSSLAAWLSEGEDPGDGWVVKADHGNAGLGNRRLGSRLSESDRRFIEGLFAEDDKVVVEPWRRRLADMCAVFTLDREGIAGGLRLHETIYTDGGALIGALFDPDAPAPPETVLRAAEVIAAALNRHDYFGPVCFDAFLYRSGGAERLRACADLNCRRAMSDAIFSLWKERHGDRSLLWRFFTTRKLRPGFAEEVLALEDRYRPERRRGILMTSPWVIELEGRSIPAPRMSVAFIGEGREEATKMEASFRARFER